MWWLAYLETGDVAKRRQLVASAARSRFKKPKAKLDADVLEIAWSVCRTENPIDAITELDPRLQEYARRSGLELSPREKELDEFFASEESKRLRAEFEKKLAEEKLLRWLEHGQQQAQGERVYLDAVVSAKKTLGQIPRLDLQLLLTSERGSRMPQSLDDLRALDEDVRGKHRSLRPIEHELVTWLMARDENGAAEKLARAAAEGLLSWDHGAKVTCSTAPARVGLRRGGDAPPLWAIAFPGGEMVSLGEADLLQTAREMFVRRGDTLFRVDVLGMPHELISLLARSPELPLEKLRNTPAGAVLAKLLDVSQTVPVRPVVELRLENELAFEVMLWAKAPDGTELLYTDGGTWVPRGGAREQVLFPVYDGEETLDDDRGSTFEAPSKEAIALEPREEDVAAVKRWIRDLVPRHASPVGPAGWTWKADPASTLKLVRSWIKKPKGVVYLGDSSFKKLVKVQTTPDVKINVAPTAIDWLEVSVEMEEELATLSLGEIADALEQSEDDLLMVHGARIYRREQLIDFQRQMEALFAAGLSPKSGKRQLHVLELSGDAGRAIQELCGEKKLGTFNGIPTAPVTEPAAGYLRPYQRTGVDFLAFAAQTFGGALLADDMGLGKTLQTLSALTALRSLSTEPPPPSLVICPASVAHNWRREAERFCPELRVVVVEGGEKRKAILAQLDNYDLVIENFALVRRDVETLERQQLFCVIVDEAQSIKNPGADTTQCVKRLRAKHRIALTGTPIENRLTDLWSIIDFTVPNHLGPLASFERHAKEEEAEVLHKMLRARLKPLLLRRLKRDVAPELPERIEERLDCEMTEGQRTAYLAEVKRTRLILSTSNDPTEMTGERRIQMLAALTRLRQICCEPSLCDLPDRGSGKLTELENLIPDLLEAGHKVLLFSQFVRMLELLETRLTALGIPYRTLTGNTKDRMQVVDAFEKDPTPSVFLISLKAGGTGLNLTSASHVILYDPWWSPALEAQAIDRSHRIGQKKTVVAVRMVTRGTIEERILELQERKKSLQRGVLEDSAMDTTLTAEDFEFLLREE